MLVVAAISMLLFVMVLHVFFLKVTKHRFLLAGCSIIAIVIAVSSFLLTGGDRIFTSVHHQGPENLRIVIGLNVGCLLILSGLRIWGIKHNT